jgi:hypothetical protein
MYTFVATIVAALLIYNFPVMGVLSAFLLQTLMLLLWSLSTLTLPWQRPEIYARGYTWNLKGFPFMCMLGIVNTITSWYLVFTGAQGSTLDSIILVVIYLAIAAINFVLAAWYNHRKGIDIMKIFTTLPPD